MDKKTIMLGMVFGSIIGGYIPSVFGASVFSIYSILGSAFGAILGIWLTYRFLS